MDEFKSIERERLEIERLRLKLLESALEAEAAQRAEARAADDERNRLYEERVARDRGINEAWREESRKSYEETLNILRQIEENTRRG